MAPASVRPLWNNKFVGVGDGTERWLQWHSCRQIHSVFGTCWQEPDKGESGTGVFGTSNLGRLCDHLANKCLYLRRSASPQTCCIGILTCPADAVKALFLDGAGNFRFPKLQKVLSVHLLNDEAAVAWAKIEQIHKIPSVDLHLDKVTDVGRAALKPPPSDAEIRNVCKVNASRSDSEQLALESNLLDMHWTGVSWRRCGRLGQIASALPSGTTQRD